MNITRFNIRVYGILIEEAHVLVSEEVQGDRLLLKFPGGGVELGEGIEDALHREWMEETGLEIKTLRHFYTTGHFVPSFLNDGSQVISIYYRILLTKALFPEIPAKTDMEEFDWVPLRELHPDMMPLPIDKVVAELLSGATH